MVTLLPKMMALSIKKKGKFQSDRCRAAGALIT
jgi:hypothetical protein